MAESRLSYNIGQKSLCDILEDMSVNELVIPDHQRTFVWKPLQEQELLDTILERLPMPNVMIHKEIGEPMYLEDGQQRLTTIQRFINGQTTTLDGRTYSQLTEAERTLFKNYQMGVTTYRNATETQVILIFNRFQQGSELNAGEKLNSLYRLSSFIRYIVNTLLKPDMGMYEIAESVWGEHTLTNSKRYKNLTQATALVAGLAFGPERFSVKWKDLRKATETEFTDEIRVKVTHRLEKMFDILQTVQTLRPRNRASWNWNFGNAIGYIAYSLTLDPVPDNLRQKWVEYLVSVIDTPGMLKSVLHRDLKGRTWNTTRWQFGFNRVFNPNWEGFGDERGEEEEEEDDYETDE